MREERFLEKIETLLAGESTRFIGIHQAPRALSELVKLSTYQLKVLYENLIDQEFIAGAPLGNIWGPPPVPWVDKDKSFLAQWVQEGLEAAAAWRYRDQYT